MRHKALLTVCRLSNADRLLRSCSGGNVFHRGTNDLVVARLSLRHGEPIRIRPLWPVPHTDLSADCASPPGIDQKSDGHPEKCRTASPSQKGSRNFPGNRLPVLALAVSCSCCFWH